MMKALNVSNAMRACAMALLLNASGVSAQVVKQGEVSVSKPWSRATAPGAKMAGGYVSIVNAGAPDRLVSASADVSAAVELHTMKMDGNSMVMAKLSDGIALPSRATVDLKPGGFHIMFIDLKAPLVEGASFPLRLKFEKAGEVTVQVKVEAMGAKGTGHTGH